MPDWGDLSIGLPKVKDLGLDRRGGAECVPEEQACILEEGKLLLIYGMRIGRIIKAYSKTVWAAEGEAVWAAGGNQIPYLDD